jgi:hypothetical protein
MKAYDFKPLIPPILLTPLRYFAGKTDQQNLNCYLNKGRIPWSKGYGAYKDNYISEALANQEVLSAFSDLNQQKIPLPEQYGYGLDERCVEYPWLIANLPDNCKNILDAGSALNHQHVLSHSKLKEKNLHLVTLSPEDKCYWQSGSSYIYSDLRDLPIKDNYYDVVACISTLEHIGFDNRIYVKRDSESEVMPNSFVQAIQEIYRVLKKNGSLFISVPFGIYRNYGTFQQFDAKLLTFLKNSLGQYTNISESYFKYTSAGWQRSNSDECSDCQYSQLTANLWLEMSETGNLDMSSGSGIESDLAAAARAVACLRITK